MENAGAVTFLEDYVFRSKVTRASYERRAETVLHEMAHMWFGDLVTMSGGTTCGSTSPSRRSPRCCARPRRPNSPRRGRHSRTSEKSWAYRQDQLPSTHPVAADIPDLAAVEVNFDGITYAKGASVLKQLVAYVGLEEFLSGLRDYFRDHAFANATFGDLLGALEKASGRDLSGWGQQWLKTTGLNTLRPDFDLDADGRFTRFAITQSGAQPGAGETRVHRLAVGIYDDDGSGKLVRTHREELDVDGETTDVPALQGVSRGKLILVNDDDLTYCSLRLDPESLQTALTRIADIADPLPRTLAWSAAWEMTREAELKARDFVSLVAEGVHAETEVGVAQRLLMQAQMALSAYADPEWARSSGLARLRRPAAGVGPRRRGRFRSPAGVRQRAVRFGAVGQAHRGVERAAGRESGHPGSGWPRGGHRSALADRHSAGRGERGRFRRTADPVHRCRGPTGPDRGGQAACRAGVCGTAAGRGKAGGVAAGDRGRHVGQHHRAVDHRRLRPARSA